MEESVDIIIKQTITESVNVDPDLKARINRFTDMVLTEAENTMKFGLSSERMAIMRLVLSAATKSVGKDFTTTENEGRVALESLFESMREIPEATHAAPVAALAPPVDDPNQGSDH